MEVETPHPRFMENSIKNFHFVFRNTSIIEGQISLFLLYANRYFELST